MKGGRPTGMSRERGGVQAHTVLAESGGEEPSAVQGPEFSVRREEDENREEGQETSMDVDQPQISVHGPRGPRQGFGSALRGLRV